ncbi:hypothetical protein BU26DRAFT_148828 [Trematosphaeria pertusa]|uniref:Uncharacterized protein n=1 Tax=Trematosphaeria pertusa TaxID=390896 RepID=A0A6A6IWP1_9PLEO|nr:uncharacterized protein BU26DRAFT_148828 [Trematosphaeria pertusa]KAF2254975.1 hypothetical protein BU26DRAFT_148828 [Trematosphaeria pertusa]
MLVAGESFPRTLSERASTSKATFRSAGFQGHSAIPFRLCSECLGGPRRQRGLDDKRGGGVCLLILIAAGISIDAAQVQTALFQSPVAHCQRSRFQCRRDRHTI